MSRLIRSCLVLVLALGPLTGCRSFHREWRAVRARAVPADQITGAWEGTWQSRAGSHTDRMRAVVSSTGPETYRVHYYAWYKRVLTFSYVAELRAIRREGGTVIFSGEADLGWLAGGLYRYEGHASPLEFFSSYDSKYEIGTFTLKRP